MSKLHLFNPENDIALAGGRENFTAPKAALALRAAGAALPLWYGDNGDALLAYGINARWFDSVTEQFGIGVSIFDHKPSDRLSPSPWGWAAAVRKDFIKEGYPLSDLPDDPTLERWRQLSHRRTASEICSSIARSLDFSIAPPATEISDIDSLRTALAGQPDSIIKSPWSSSGRGLIDARRISAEEVIRRCEGIIRRQGSVMVEKAYDRTVDFAMLFECGNGDCNFVGYSLFATDNSGAYTGNVLATDNRLIDMIGHHYPAERLSAVAEALRSAIAGTIAPTYRGPVGVDMLVARMPDGSALLDATVELNLRMTMGFVAHAISDRYLADESVGQYSVVPDKSTPAPDNMIVEDRRMISGRMYLTPPGGLFRFAVETRTL